MKIGILTQPLINNYGGILQNYALQKILKDNGHEVVTLDWRPKDPPRYIIILSAIKTFLNKLVGRSRHYRYQLSRKEENIINQNFTKFIDKYINHTSKSQTIDGLRIQMLNERCEALIVGSDQCWRPSYCYGFETAMFCDFAESDNIIKLTYAVSLGTDVWEYSVEQTKVLRRLIKSFSFVSVRENSAIGLCNKELGINPIQVLDPTLLLRKDDYLELINNAHIHESSRLFYYILDPTESKRSFVQSVANSMNLSTFTILPKYQAEIRTKYNVKNNISDCIFPPIENWIQAFADASVVVVDSFHGCVFSIIFNKTFWVIGNEHRGLSRFTSLLSMFNLESRLVSENQFNHIDVNSKIDWNRVNSILDSKRSFCLDLLLSQLK